MHVSFDAVAFPSLEYRKTLRTSPPRGGHLEVMSSAAFFSAVIADDVGSADWWVSTLSRIPLAPAALLRPSGRPSQAEDRGPGVDDRGLIHADVVRSRQSMDSGVSDHRVTP